MEEIGIQIAMRHQSIINKAIQEGTLRKMSWGEFWQIFNRFKNSERYDPLLLHLRLNWNRFWVKPDIRGRLAE